MVYKYQMIAATDIGRVRQVNEDSLRIVPSLNLAVVADGMGGHKAGDLASRMAVTSVCEHFEQQMMIGNYLNNFVAHNILSDAFKLANIEIYSHSRQVLNYDGMGTTLLTVAFQETEIQIGHIGDSRLYRFAGGEMEQLTLDHTLAAEMSIDTPEKDIPSYSYHILRKALGIDPSCSPDFFTVQPNHGDLYLMCSDGLTGVLSDQEIGTMLALRSHQPEYCLGTIIETCLSLGAPDNISIILIYTTSS